jgi:hypothetical protein
MANVTLSIEDDLLVRSREYARAHRTTLNGMVRNLLRSAVGGADYPTRLSECLELADQANGHSAGRRWKRSDLYDA